MQNISIKTGTTAETVFTTALDLPPDGRPAYLTEACKEDLPLRQKVEDLLRAHEAPVSFLPEQPASASIPSATFPITEKEGDFVGPYKLIEKIGEGGFGVVYVAEQVEPIRRRVAIKIIKLGMDTRQVVARFQAERQALAMMDHPNIAKVLDAGAMQSGRPYFVMELVEGVKITEFCNNAKLSVRQRLDLFIEICETVQHAHQKGIIHRDLKPSNILVSLQEGRPVPKVIDFGIAKATQGQLTDKTVLTGFEQFMGTPSYMSPEQAQLGGKDIDTRSDIYSLGVLLFELLTGRTPFDQEQLLQRGLDEVRRIIREQEPPRPSVALIAMPPAELIAMAANRQTERGKLIHSVRGDLDWIVMRCLEKERERRYETANGLAMDIQRHLAQEPVLASPPGTVYRLRKLVRRNKGTFVAVAAVTAALLIGGVVSVWQAVRATSAGRQAKVEAQENRLANELLGDSFVELARVSFLNGNEQRVNTILDQINDRIERGNLADQPEAKAYADSIMGRIYLRLEDFEKAKAMEEMALDLRRQSPVINKRELADSHLFLAEALQWSGDTGGAKTNYDAALKLDPTVVERNPAYLKQRGFLLAQHGQWEEAAKCFVQAINAKPNDYLNWYWLMPALIQSGRIADYKARCQEILRLFAKTEDASAAHAAVQSCLLLPSAVDQNQLADAAAWEMYSFKHRPGSDPSSWYQLTRALLDYRQGQFAQSLQTIGLVRERLTYVFTKLERNLCDADACFVSAMAHFQLHESDEAKRQLQRGLEIVRTKVPKLDSGDLTVSWYDISVTYLLMREANETVGDKKPTATESLK
ncbi:MAG TPA: serine/threonine-protein kinase [Candidatus Cybelea sp.]|nr:serine/threonine-protein kinase [Candidatus Cybelea sp.]